MKHYSVRPPRISDLESVYAIIAQQNTIDYGSAVITLDELRKRWQEINLQNDACIAYLENEPVGYAELLDGDSPYIYLADRLNVDLAFQLLMILEGKVTSQKKEKVDLFTRVSEKNRTLLQLFASNGYHSTLSFLIMEMTLHEPPPAPQWPDGISVRTFIRGQDEQATYRADEEAAQDKGYHDPLSYEGWVKRMRMDQESFDPSLWFLACEGRSEEIAGVALNLYAQQSDTGWVDHLSVRRAWRNRGIGRALLLHSLTEFHARNIRQVKLSVDSKSLTNAPRLYESIGMQTIQQYHIYHKEIDSTSRA
jgi:ribosomal protein S18 acetylase RimI-like enzyme